MMRAASANDVQKLDCLWTGLSRMNDEDVPGCPVGGMAALNILERFVSDSARDSPGAEEWAQVNRLVVVLLQRWRRLGSFRWISADERRWSEENKVSVCKGCKEMGHERQHCAVRPYSDEEDGPHRAHVVRSGRGTSKVRGVAGGGARRRSRRKHRPDSARVARRRVQLNARLADCLL